MQDNSLLWSKTKEFYYAYCSYDLWYWAHKEFTSTSVIIVLSFSIGHGINMVEELITVGFYSRLLLFQLMYIANSKVFVWYWIQLASDMNFYVL